MITKLGEMDESLPMFKVLDARVRKASRILRSTRRRGSASRIDERRSKATQHRRRRTVTAGGSSGGSGSCASLPDQAPPCSRALTTRPSQSHSY